MMTSEDDFDHKTTHDTAWYWRQRPKCAIGNLSISYWQRLRVLPLAGQYCLAMRYSKLFPRSLMPAQPWIGRPLRVWTPLPSHRQLKQPDGVHGNLTILEKKKQIESDFDGVGCL